MSVELTDNTDEFKAALNAALQRGLEKIGLKAEGYAILKVPVAEGTLKQSITHKVEGDEVYVGSDLYYAPYVELGTGIFAGKGDGWWVYVKGANASSIAAHGKRYTEEEARKVVAILQSKGLDAHMTHGRKPAHFLRDAAMNHAQEYGEMLRQELENA